MARSLPDLKKAYASSSRYAWPTKCYINKLNLGKHKDDGKDRERERDREK